MPIEVPVSRGLRRPSRVRRRNAMVVAYIAASSMVLGVVSTGADAQIDPTSTTSTTSSSTSTSTSLEEGPTTTLDPNAPTTDLTATSVVETSTTLDPLAPTTTNVYANTDEGSADGPTLPPQQGFDAASKMVLNDELLAVMQERQGLADMKQAAQDRLVTLKSELASAQEQLVALGVDSKTKIEQAAAAKISYQRHIIEMVIRSDDSLGQNPFVQDPYLVSLGREFSTFVTKRDRQAIADYQEKSYALTEEQRAKSDEIAVAQSKVQDVERQLVALEPAIAEAEIKLKAYGAGSRVYVKGFVFPVLGPVNFSDDYGAPRLAGTAQAHSHQGNDIMAPFGRELVAVEAGVLDKVGTNGLGGNRLWVKGASGTDYYYAHLTAFAPGMTDGTSVRAGQVIGYVGNTGDARWGPPHLHFEIHPGGKGAVNPFPMLKASFGDQPMASYEESIRGPGSMLELARSQGAG